MRNDGHRVLSCGSFLAWEAKKAVEHLLDYVGWSGRMLYECDYVMVSVTEGEFQICSSVVFMLSRVYFTPHREVIETRMPMLRKYIVFVIMSA